MLCNITYIGFKSKCNPRILQKLYTKLATGSSLLEAGDTGSSSSLSTLPMSDSTGTRFRRESGKVR